MKDGGLVTRKEAEMAGILKEYTRRNLERCSQIMRFVYSNYYNNDIISEFEKIIELNRDKELKGRQSDAKE